jgi:hypothetical protein
MGVLDFLFQGQPPKAVTTYGTSTQNIPQFMSDYTLGLLNKASAVAGEPYQAYTGPRMAAFRPEQTKAFEMTGQSVGKFDPQMAQAFDATKAATGYDAMKSAQPYITQAGQSAADVVGDYMNPYTESVVNRLGDLGARQLQEKFMPAIGQQFIRSGQYGSTGMQAATGKALRDVQESTLAQQNQALATGYGQSLGAAQADLSRYGNLGQLQGNLASQSARDQLAAGSQFGNLANMGQTMNLKDLAALESVGQTQQTQAQKNLDLGYQDFLEQRKYPSDQLSMLNSLIRGLPYSTASTTTGTGPASSYSASPLSQVAGTASLLSALSGVKFAQGGDVDVVTAQEEKRKYEDAELSKVKFAKGGMKRNKNRRSSRGRR